jgi:hypothetical protein
MGLATTYTYIDRSLAIIRSARPNDWITVAKFQLTRRVVIATVEYGEIGGRPCLSPLAEQ